MGEQNLLLRESFQGIRLQTVFRRNMPKPLKTDFPPLIYIHKIVDIISIIYVWIRPKVSQPFCSKQLLTSKCYHFTIYTMLAIKILFIHT